MRVKFEPDIINAHMYVGQVSVINSKQYSIRNMYYTYEHHNCYVKHLDIPEESVLHRMLKCWQNSIGSRVSLQNTKSFMNRIKFRYNESNDSDITNENVDKAFRYYTASFYCGESFLDYRAHNPY